MSYPHCLQPSYWAGLYYLACSGCGSGLNKGRRVEADIRLDLRTSISMAMATTDMAAPEDMAAVMEMVTVTTKASKVTLIHIG